MILANTTDIEFPIKTQRVGIFTFEGDLHAIEVADQIEKDGGEAVVLIDDHYCHSWTVTITADRSEIGCRLTTPKGDFGLDDFSAWWIRRRPTMRTTPNSSSEEVFLETQRVHFLQGFIQLVSYTARCVDPLDRVLRAQSKALQLKLALKNGLLIPSTFSGGDPSIALDWISHTDGPLCSKAIEAGRFTDESGQQFGRYTSPFERRGLDDLASLQDCPVTIQEFIPKLLELRVTVIGQRILTAAIDTSTSNQESKVDWRHYDWANTKYSVFQLPSEMQLRILALMKDLGLTFGAIDLILDPQGRYVFLEVNPIGQFLWIEDLTDLPICRTMAGHLLAA